MISPMRRCPFSENIDRSVVVSLVGSATIRTRPHAVSQGDRLVDAAACQAQLRGREPCTDVLHNGSRFTGNYD